MEYDYPNLGNFRACADSGYQALFFPAPPTKKREPGDEATCGHIRRVMLYVILISRARTN